MGSIRRSLSRYANLARLRSRFDADELIDFARRRAEFRNHADGLDNNAGLFDALKVLAHSLGNEAELSLFGKWAVRWDVARFLGNLARLDAEERRHPAIRAQPIDKPIFVTGMPRAGTSFLHRLLADDKLNLVPLCWQTIYPYPETARPGFGRRARSDRRAKTVNRQLDLFRLFAPEMRKVHPFSAESPQECTEITAHLFQSLRFDTTFHVPSYRKWLDEAGHVEAYRFHRRFLQHLQYQMAPFRSGGGEKFRWVLKCPDHVFALDAIKTVYPDARFVFCHRDPLRVLASVAYLTEILRRPFTRRVDRAQIGRQVALHWAEGARHVMAASEPGASGQHLIYHLDYRDLTGDPVAAIAGLYDRFGLDLTEDARLAMTRHVAAKPRGGYGENIYRLEEFGLDPAHEKRRFADYVAGFGLQPEAAG